MNRPKFTREQLTWLRETLKPECCHVSGMHDPTHWSEGRYVCRDQKAGAYDHLRTALGFAAVKPQDCVSPEDCGWCHEDGETKKSVDAMRRRGR
jgi:hypothetical protein